MATWSEWFKKAKEKNFPLEKFLTVNQPEDMERLHSSGLPFYDFLLIDGKNFENEKQGIKEFSEKHEKKWIRISNKTDKGERYYKLNLKSLEEIVCFIESLKINISNFNIQLFEFAENKFGGNIVSNNESLKIEIIASTQERVSRSNEKFFHGQTNATGSLSFFEENTPKEIADAAKKTIEFLRISRNEFIKGYFEFAISEKGKIYFLDYKKQSKAYTS